MQMELQVANGNHVKGSGNIVQSGSKRRTTRQIEATVNGNRVEFEYFGVNGTAKYHSWLLPRKRLRKLIRYDAQVKTLLVRVAFYASKALGKGFGVTMLAARFDFSASSDRVPSGICPLDF
jgi:hypothetical protein